MSDETQQAFCEVVELPLDRQPVIRIIPMPADTNAHGTIFGGWVMAQVD